MNFDVLNSRQVAHELKLEHYAVSSNENKSESIFHETSDLTVFPQYHDI